MTDIFKMLQSPKLNTEEEFIYWIKINNIIWFLPEGGLDFKLRWPKKYPLKLVTSNSVKCDFEFEFIYFEE